MPRTLSSVLLAALVAASVAAIVVSTAALGSGGIVELAAEADETPHAAPVEPPEATRLEPGDPTAGVTPRTVTPQRDLDVLAIGEPAPEPREVHGASTLLAAAGTSQDPVFLGGSIVRFSVEVEEATDLDPDSVATVVERALYDERSWARDHDLQRVAPDDAWLHVLVATPETVDRLCRGAGLNTSGWLSCWTGDTAAINIDRWNVGVAHVEDLDLYRRYVVNHEVGHGLGHGHRDCPGDGQVAPLMQQQTISLDGCIANPWRYPDG